MIHIIATAESSGQAEALIAAGVDTLYIGGNRFGLRMPGHITLEEIGDITKFAHRQNRKVYTAVNGLMHNGHIEALPEYLSSLEKTGVDAITAGDPGVIQLLKEMKLNLPYIYDAQTLVTSANQIKFWLKRGAIGAVAARECTFIELKEIQAQIKQPVEVQVYGPTCIHHSKRRLLSNYTQFAHLNAGTTVRDRLSISEKKDRENQYPLFEDENGTHIFSAEDIALIRYLPDLHRAGLDTWKLDGILAKGETFTDIAALYVRAKEAVLSGTFDAARFSAELLQLQPETRKLGTGFFLRQPDEVQ
ncbi:peptidase U32 family protein [Heyndrickxia coagulans]|uniref:peptidase U32 family protein n=1 Tax=Heyndrickxia coagulans TaxID=1398 RepID=UPI00042353CB|nr:peptidase U32 family protein [Heyndrickxia coagulans]